MGIVTLILVGGAFAAGIYVGRTLGGRQDGGVSSPRPHPASPSPHPVLSSPRPVPQSSCQSSSAPVAPLPGREWFLRQMKAYEEAMLAYFISKCCLERRVSAVKTMELYQRYGHVPLQPSLVGYEAGFQEQGLTVAKMNEYGVAWLRGLGGEATMDTWEEKAAAHLEAIQRPKAEQIVRDALAQ